MKESMEDRIIERYLNGEMRPEEEKEFRELLELEPELKRKMDAERIVQRALEHDRAEIQPEESGSYARFLAALATSVPAAEGVLMQGAASSSTTTGVAGSTAAATGSAGALSGGFASAFLATGLAKGLTAIALVATMATGVYVATPSAEQQNETRPAAIERSVESATEGLPAIVDSTAASQLAPEQQIVEPTPAPAMMEEKKEMVTEDPAAANAAANGSKSEEHSLEQSRSGMQPKEVATPVEKKETDLDAMLKNMEKDASRDIDVIESDSVATKLKMGKKKQ
jgi:hypothetical protein